MKKSLISVLMIAIVCFANAGLPVFSMELPQLMMAQSESGIISGAKKVVANEKYVFLASTNEIFIYNKNDIKTPITTICRYISSNSDVKMPVENIVLKDEKLIVNFTLASGGNGQPAINIYNVNEIEDGENMDLLITGWVAPGAGTSVVAYENYLIAKIRSNSTLRTDIYELSEFIQQARPQPMVIREGFAPRYVYASGGYLFAREAESDAVNIYKISDLADATKETKVLCNLSIDSALPVNAVCADEQYVFLSTDSAENLRANKIFVYDISTIESLNPSAPLVQQYNANGRVTSLTLNGNVLLISAQDENTVKILDVSDVNDIQVLTTLAPEGSDGRGFQFCIEDEILYICNYGAGLSAYQLPQRTLMLSAIKGEMPLGALSPGSFQTKLSYENFFDIEGAKGKVIIAKYKGNQLDELTSQDVQIMPGEGIGEINIESISVENEDNRTIQMFFFDGFDNLIPLTEKLNLERADFTHRNEFYVDAQTGSDHNNGEKETPFKTIHRAREEVRRINRRMTTDIYVYLKNGTYYLEDTLCFEEKDSGFNGFNVIYKAAEGAQPVISGGTPIEGWTLFDEEKNIYKASAKGADNRHLYVDGKRAVRARSEGNVGNFVSDGGVEGFTCSNTEFLQYKNFADVEFVFLRGWVSRRAHPLNVESVDADTVKVNIRNWDRVNDVDYKKPESVYYYENAYELLDEEGEFYIDKQADTVYYKPITGTDIHSSVIVAPKLETVISVCGESVVKPAHNIVFSGITFKDSTWLSPNHHDFLDTQNLYPEQPEAAVFLKNANHIKIEKCTIKNCGGDGLGATRTVQDCTFLGNNIYDISARGIHLGDWNGPEDSRIQTEIASGFVIENNYIHAIGEEYYSAPALSGVFIADTQIRHNEIFDVPYSGMHIGWGWDSYEKTSVKNLDISYNYIHDYMHTCADGGAVYFLGATGASAENMNEVYQNHFKNAGSGTEGVMYCDSGSNYYRLSENVIDNHESVWNGYYGLGSSYNEFVDNYTTSEMFNLVSENSATPVGTKVYANGNWPQAARNIINDAGLEDEYKYLSAGDGDAFVLKAVHEMTGVSGVMCANDTLAFIKKSETQVSVYDVTDIEVLAQTGKIEYAANGETYTVEAMEIKENHLFVHFSKDSNHVVVLYDVSNAKNGVIQKISSLNVPENMTMLVNNNYLVIAKAGNYLDLYNISALVENGFLSATSNPFEFAKEMYIDDEYLYAVRDNIVDIYVFDGTEMERKGACPVTEAGIQSVMRQEDRLYVTTKLPMGNKGNLYVYDMSSLSPSDTDGSGMRLIKEYAPIEYEEVIDELEKSRVVTSVQNEKYIFEINAANKTKIDVKDAVSGDTITTITHAMSNTDLNYVFGSMCLQGDKLVVTCKRNGGNGNPEVALYDVGNVVVGATLEPIDNIGIYNADNGIVFKNDTYVFLNDITLGTLYVCSLDNEADPFKRSAKLYTKSNNMFADNHYLYVHNETENVVEIYSLEGLPHSLSSLHRVGIIPHSVEDINNVLSGSYYPARSICKSGDFILTANSMLVNISVTNGEEDMQLKLYEIGNHAVGLFAHQNYVYAIEKGKRLLIYERVK
ncbi:MAG: right-handed parallel beta-helix repeat-containing protein [Clostridia bacterium]|nr:right-handed parallel beta-helix repeat-containing protein [Clostridia bacterium]